MRDLFTVHRGVREGFRDDVTPEMSWVRLSREGQRQWQGWKNGTAHAGPQTPGSRSLDLMDKGGVSAWSDVQQDHSGQGKSI